MPTDTKKKDGRATVQLSKDFHKKLKIKAAKEGKTIKQLIEEKFKEE
ncbi:MAG: toxin-antitoxin system HicB family antitoxin [Phaeodactylibacter sp.]|nr:toxin-antitoxin system HicB family antitoxin [Phaeodactylibacter sp.]